MREWEIVSVCVRVCLSVCLFSLQKIPFRLSEPFFVFGQINIALGFGKQINFDEFFPNEYLSTISEVESKDEGL